MRIDNNFKINQIAGERIVIMQSKDSVDMTRVISLNETAEWLWKQLENKDFETEDVADLLFQRFDVEKDRALEDAKTWVETLSRNHIIINA